MVSESIRRMIAWFDGDVTRINHALKVYGFAKAILGAEELSLEEGLAVELAAVLHDIGIKEAERKYRSAAGTYQETEGPPIARGILQEMETDRQVTERVCFIIGNHHSYHRIDGLDFQILVEADFLVNISEGGMEPDAVKSIKSKYFKTAAGIRILESLYRV